jgi:hypothetical protein
MARSDCCPQCLKGSTAKRLWREAKGERHFVQVG